MQQFDDIVSSWLSGSDSVEGQENPAGPLYMEGTAATEASMTDPDTVTSVLTSYTSASCLAGGGTHCLCC